AADRSYAITKFVCKLNSQMSKSADALNGHQVSRPRAAMAQRVVSSNSRTQQRRSFRRIEAFRNEGKSLNGSEHVLLVSAIKADAGDLAIRTQHQIATAALIAGSIMPAMPSDAHALAFLPSGNACADLANH